jgi:hypothetical protein
MPLTYHIPKDRIIAINPAAVNSLVDSRSPYPAVFPSVFRKNIGRYLNGRKKISKAYLDKAQAQFVESHDKVRRLKSTP